MQANNTGKVETPVASVPRPHSGIFSHATHLISFILVFFLFGALFLQKMLASETGPIYQRSVYAASAAFSLLVAFANFVVLRRVSRRPFAILKTGIELEGLVLQRRTI